MSVFKRYTSSNEWEQLQGNPETLPSQTGNRGKFLQTNGTTVSWQDMDSFIYQGPTPPDSPVEGDLWIDTSINSSEGRLIPPGGTTGQVFAKTSSADYNAGWVDLNIDTLGGVPDTRTINGKSLDSNIDLNINDITNAMTVINEKISKLVFNNKTVTTSDWISDSTYTDYEYKAVIDCEGVTSDHYVEVIFDPADAGEGQLASVCLSGTDTVTIYSQDNTMNLTIPTIIALT